MNFYSKIITDSPAGLDLVSVLGERRIWAPYELTSRGNGKLGKPPIDAITGQSLKWGDAERVFWNYKQAFEAATRLGLPGVGLFTGNGLGALDLDDCIKNGKLLSRAEMLVKLMGSYSELSPSKTGLHIIFEYDERPFEGRAPEKVAIEWATGIKGKIEFYFSRHYLTCTGDTFPQFCPIARKSKNFLRGVLHAYLPSEASPAVTAKGVSHSIFPPTHKLSDSELLRLAHGKDAAFAAYWRGNPANLRDSSRSGIRFALCCKLAFSCGSDEQRARRIAETSPFYASLDDRGRADFARLFSRDYHKAQQRNPARFGSAA